jgi:hypothetical protein
VNPSRFPATVAVVRVVAAEPVAVGAAAVAVVETPARARAQVQVQVVGPLVAVEPLVAAELVAEPRAVRLVGAPGALGEWVLASLRLRERRAPRKSDDLFEVRAPLFAES